MLFGNLLGLLHLWLCSPFKARHNLAMDNEGLLLASLRLIAAPPI